MGMGERQRGSCQRQKEGDATNDDGKISEDFLRDKIGEELEFQM